MKALGNSEDNLEYLRKTKDLIKSWRFIIDKLGILKYDFLLDVDI